MNLHNKLEYQQHLDPTIADSGQDKKRLLNDLIFVVLLMYLLVSASCASVLVLGACKNIRSTAPRAGEHIILSTAHIGSPSLQRIASLVHIMESFVIVWGSS